VRVRRLRQRISSAGDLSTGKVGGTPEYYAAVHLLPRDAAGVRIDLCG